MPITSAKLVVSPTAVDVVKATAVFDPVLAVAVPDANVAVIIELKNHNALAGKGSLRHSYPHSWRSKAPVIFRNTPQWFISMEKNDLRKKALKAIDDVSWFPKQGKKRIFSMIEERPDWVVSRQRAWGVPLSIFYNKKTGEPLVDSKLN